MPFLNQVQNLLADFRENNLDYLSYIASKPTHGDEAMVRQKVVEKLLTALGYNLSTEVQPEERAGTGSADIYVQAIGTDPANPKNQIVLPTCVWELKRTGIRGNDLIRYEKQLQSYVLLKRVRYGVLTNGHEIRLYERVGERIQLNFALNLTAYTPQAIAPATEQEQMALQGLFDVLNRHSFLEVERFKLEIVSPPRHPLILSSQHPHNEDGLIEALKKEIQQLKRLVILNFYASHRQVQELETEDIQRIDQLNQCQEDLLKTVTDLQERLKRPLTVASLETYLQGFRQQWGRVELKSFIERAFAESGVEAHLKGADRSTFENRARRYYQAATERQSWRLKREAELQTPLRLVRDFERWRDEIGVMVEDATDEFCLQTVYIFITRLLLIRICEDKGILKEKISDGGYQFYLEFSQKFYDYLGHANRRLLSIAYDDTSFIYGHFFSDTIFDWYAWEEETIVRLLHVLNPYDFATVSADLIGRIYEQYVDSLERKRKGQFYTPAGVVGLVLDAAGYQGPEIVGKRLLDPACGSGRFLVEAARRLIPQWEAVYQKNGAVDYQELVNNRLRHALYGLDVNRFACFLAEVNLVVQVLDLFQKHHQQFTILRFHIYPTNSLLPDELNGHGRFGLTALSGNDPLSQERFTAELIKERLAHPTDEWLDFQPGFDFVVGNPPYVRADNPSVAGLRQRIAGIGRYPSLYKKWDLFIPFMDMALNLLAENGRHAFIVSDALQTEEYARLVRQRLLTETTIHHLIFAPGVYFFQEAAVFTVIYGVQNSPPPQDHLVQRQQLHSDQIHHPHAARPLPALSQQEHGEQIFRPEFTGKEEFDFSNCLHLNQICYINAGLELQSHEKFDLVVEGNRQKLFVKDDLLSQIKTGTHIKQYVEAEEVGEFVIYSHRWLEWGTKRIPDQLRRARFPELFENAKILVALSGNAYYDANGQYYNQANSVSNCVPYHAFSKPETLKRVARAVAREITDQEVQEAVQPLPSNFEYLSPTQKAELLIATRAKLSPQYDLHYLTALLNCGWLRHYMMTFVKRGSRQRFYPDDLKQWPVAPAPAETQAAIGQVVSTIMAAKADLQTLKAEGHALSPTAGPQLNLVRLLQQWHTPTGDLLDAAAFVDSHIAGPPGHTIRQEGERIIFRQQPLSYLASPHLAVQTYLRRYLESHSETLRHTPAEHLAKHIKIPRSVTAVTAFMSQVEQEEHRWLLRQMDALQGETWLEEWLFDVYGVAEETRQKLNGRIYHLTTLPTDLLYVSLLHNEQDTPLRHIAFPWQGSWAIRTQDKLPTAMLCWGWDGTQVYKEWVIL